MALYSVPARSTGGVSSSASMPSGRPVGALSVVKDASGKERVYWRESSPSAPLQESAARYSSKPAGASPSSVAPGPESLHPSASPASRFGYVPTEAQARRRLASGHSTSPSHITDRLCGVRGRTVPRDVCPRLATRLRVTVPPRVSEDGVPVQDQRVTVHLTLADLEELMNLIEREQRRSSRHPSRQGVNLDLDEVVQQQRQELRILSAEIQKTKAALEEKGFLLEKERRQNAVLSRQLSLLRKLREAERKGFQGSLKAAGNQLERELEKYVAAAYRQNLSFFGETTAAGTSPDEEGQYGQLGARDGNKDQECDLLGPAQETVERYEREEGMAGVGNAAALETAEGGQYGEGAGGEGVGDVEEEV